MKLQRKRVGPKTFEDVYHCETCDNYFALTRECINDSVLMSWELVPNLSEYIVVKAQ
jgi:hypothetical protein